MLKEFLDFLKNYSVLGLAIAVILGGKVNAFVSATVADIIMPIVGALAPDGEWKTWTLDVGGLSFGLGHWLGAAIDFLIVAFVIFLIAKLVLRESQVVKR